MTEGKATGNALNTKSHEAIITGGNQKAHLIPFYFTGINIRGTQKKSLKTQIWAIFKREKQ